MADTEDQISLSRKAPGTSQKRRPAPRPMAPNWFRLGYLIHDVSRMRRTLYDHHMKPEGITRSQWWVLANLSRHSETGVMSTELAKLLDVGKVTLSGLIDRLEVAGYVYRRADKLDRRARLIFITEAGYLLIDRMRGITERLNQQICAGLTPDEVERIERRLIHIKENLRSLLAEERIIDEIAGENIGG